MTGCLVFVVHTGQIVRRRAFSTAVGLDRKDYFMSREPESWMTTNCVGLSLVESFSRAESDKDLGSGSFCLARKASQNCQLIWKSP
jgi:hypothetical protein